MVAFLYPSMAGASLQLPPIGQKIESCKQTHSARVSEAEDEVDYPDRDAQRDRPMAAVLVAGGIKKYCQGYREPDRKFPWVFTCEFARAYEIRKYASNNQAPPVVHQASTAAHITGRRARQNWRR